MKEYPLSSRALVAEQSETPPTAASPQPGTATAATPAGFGLVLLAATLWGTFGVAIRMLLASQAVTPLGLAYFRAGFSWLVLVVALGVFRPHLLRIRRDDVGMLALYGAISVSAFYYLYIQAVDLTNIATAVVLLYTAPAWVVVLAWRFQGETLRKEVLVALALTFAGIALVAGISDPDVLGTRAPGVIVGLVSGLTYALYSIFGKWAMRRYESWTVMVYVLGFGTLFLSPFQALSGSTLFPIGFSLAGWLGLAFVVLGPTLGALAAYTEGLRRLPASTASILSSWEPAVGALLGYLVLGETLTPVQLGGGVLIVLGVLVLGSRRRTGMARPIGQVA